MQTFNKVTCQNLRRDLGTILAKYGTTTGIEFNVGSMRFLPNETSIKITARIAGTPKKEEKALEHWIVRFGLKEVNFQGFKLVEYQERRYKFPFIYINSIDGKKYKTDLSGLKRLGFVSTPV